MSGLETGNGVECSDTQLALRIADGNGEANEAFGVLYNRYFKLLVGFIIRRYHLTAEAAEDVAQESLFNAYKKMKNAEYDGNFNSWIHQISSNAAISHLRREYRHTPAVLASRVSASERDETGCQPEPSDYLIEQRSHADLHAAIDRLPSDLRSPLKHRYFDDMHLKDIAAIEHTSSVNISRRITRARKILAEMLVPTSMANAS